MCPLHRLSSLLRAEVAETNKQTSKQANKQTSERCVNGAALPPSRSTAVLVQSSSRRCLYTRSGNSIRARPGFSEVFPDVAFGNSCRSCWCDRPWPVLVLSKSDRRVFPVSVASLCQPALGQETITSLITNLFL